MILVFLVSLIAQIKETTVTVGCPPFRRIFPRGKPSSCDGFQNFSFIIPRGQRKDIFLEDHDTSDKLVDYDLEKLGCPFKILKNEPFKPFCTHLFSRLIRCASHGKEIIFPLFSLF
ncbi:uncharacterized protein LOC122947616 [Acropora millepora]|uniref:uncharacterized protein LOC122947616 n=1 Tax=Acropora millepora TaxID=45264 RepID=UPI001CF16643|nr:uncharacterized protein LOC122947616 [Acropora millepora]